MQQQAAMQQQAMQVMQQQAMQQAMQQLLLQQQSMQQQAMQQQAMPQALPQDLILQICSSGEVLKSTITVYQNHISICCVSCRQWMLRL